MLEKYAFQKLSKVIKLIEYEGLFYLKHKAPVLKLLNPSHYNFKQFEKQKFLTKLDMRFKF